MLVKDRRTREKLVIKHIPLAGLDEQEVNEAFKEAEALRMLKHPNIVGFRDSWASDGVRAWERLTESEELERRSSGFTAAFLVPAAQCAPGSRIARSLNILTEYVDGGSLERLLQRNDGLLDEELVAMWFAQLVMALEHMHHNCVLHRDIKPANIFITRSGLVKLGDLGCCKLLEAPDEESKSDQGERRGRRAGIERTSPRGSLYGTSCVPL